MTSFNGLRVLSLSSSSQSFGYIFSDEADVVELVSKVMPLVASFQVSRRDRLVHIV